MPTAHSLIGVEIGHLLSLVVWYIAEDCWRRHEILKGQKLGLGPKGIIGEAALFSWPFQRRFWAY